MLQKWDSMQPFLPISSQWSLSIPPENIRKPLVFWCFQGISKENSGMKWVNSVFQRGSIILKCTDNILSRPRYRMSWMLIILQVIWKWCLWSLNPLYPFLGQSLVTVFIFSRIFIPFFNIFVVYILDWVNPIH